MFFRWHTSTFFSSSSFQSTVMTKMFLFVLFLQLSRAQRSVRDIEEVIQVIEDRQTEVSTASGFDVKTIMEEIDMEVRTRLSNLSHPEVNYERLWTPRAGWYSLNCF